MITHCIYIPNNKYKVLIIIKPIHHIYKLRIFKNKYTKYIIYVLKLCCIAADIRLIICYV